MSPHYTNTCHFPDSTAEEYEELKAIEHRINQKYLVLFSLAQDLKLIKDRKLYLSTHPSFNQYCLDKFGLEAAYFDEILRIGDVIEDLKCAPIKSRPCPSNYEQIQPFFDLTRPERIELAKCVNEELGNNRLSAELILACKLRLYPDKCVVIKDSEAD